MTVFYAHKHGQNTFPSFGRDDPTYYIIYALANIQITYVNRQLSLAGSEECSELAR